MTIDDYLDSLDAAAGWQPESGYFPESFDEWNAIRLVTGRPAGTFTEYLHWLNQRGSQKSYQTLVYFGAVDDDDDVPGEDERCLTKR